MKKEERKEVDLDSFFEEDFPVNEDFSEEALLACSDNADNEIPLTMSNVDESGGEVLKEERGSKLSNSTRFGGQFAQEVFRMLFTCTQRKCFFVCFNLVKISELADLQ